VILRLMPVNKGVTMENEVGTKPAKEIKWPLVYDIDKDAISSQDAWWKNGFNNGVQKSIAAYEAAREGK